MQICMTFPDEGYNSSFFRYKDMQMVGEIVVSSAGR